MKPWSGRWVFAAGTLVSAVDLLGACGAIGDRVTPTVPRAIASKQQPLPLTPTLGTTDSDHGFDSRALHADRR
jgi:hypothetical protein